MARMILEGTEHCPFCGCKKVFLKAESVKWADIDPITRRWSDGYRIKAAGQCAKCHIRGPYVYSEPQKHRPEPDGNLIVQVIAKWNERH